ncbi:unnamed protein product [Effrenium voratum]|uniref:DNA polymerase n=1 Tax=Effrenium voratum TaxID=2562239 RepID=A0AA36I1I7_9DINO|nr:unnamed protein product [Effrenium voratum]
MTCETGVSCVEQYKVPEPKKIIQEVSEKEYRDIVEQRRSDWVVGDSGYVDNGKELWQGPEAAKQRARADEAERKLLAEMEADSGKKPKAKAKPDSAPSPPSGRGALLGALQKGAAAVSNLRSSPNKKENKVVDDLLAQMCEELEAESVASPPKRKLETPPEPACKRLETVEELAKIEQATPPKEAAKPSPAMPPSPEPARTAAQGSPQPTAGPGQGTPPRQEAEPKETKTEPCEIKLVKPVAAPTGCKPLLDDKGGLWFFFIDAVEDDRSSPPRVYLFGKVLSASKEFVSCCLVVEKLERCVHLLLKGSEDDEQAAQEAAQAADAEFDALCQKHPAVKKLRSKLKWRNYAFEKALQEGLGNLPFLKVLCDASGGLPPLGPGTNFSHAFGVQTSLLERLLLSRRIMGPGWYRLLPGSFYADPARLSYCGMEFRINPRSLQVARTESDRAELAKAPAGSPPLRVMSCCLQTLQPSAQMPHEVLAVACTAQALSVDAETPSAQGHWAAVRRLEGSPFPRDAEKDLAKKGIQCCNNELALLTAFMDKVQQFDPDVIAGHNAYAFDLDVMAGRMNQLKIQQWHRLGRLRRKERVPRAEGRQGGFWVGSKLVAGRLVCDVMLQSKDLLPKMGCYDLPNLAREQLGAELKIVEPEAIASYYSSARDLETLVQLKLRGAELVAQLTQALQILPLTRQLTNLAGNLWNASLQNKRAERNELLLCHEFHRKKFVLPDKENATQKKKRMHEGFGLEEDEDVPAQGKRKAAYSGGLVLEPKAGLYDDFVMLLDFNSLYPSIIQEHNICFTTVDRPDENEVAKAANEAQLLAQTHAPDAMAEEGILPQVLRRLVDSRRQVKAAIKSEKNPRILKILEIRQKALKLTANSMYGCLGFQNSRFYAKPLAALITAKGREALQTTITVVQQELQLDVVYGDTDSVFVNAKTQDYQQAMQVGEQIKRSVNKRYKRLEIEIDGVFARLMLLKKKKYAALKVVSWGEKPTFETEFKGLDIVRRDWCKLAKELGEAILNRILDRDSNQEESVHWVHQFLSDKAKEMDENQVPLEKYVITKGLTKDPKDYPDAKNQPHVQVALRMMSRGKAVRPGQEVEYVVCNPSGEAVKASLADRARHPHELEMDSNLSLDVAWYKKQQVHPLVTRLLAVVEGTSPGRLAECLGAGVTFQWMGKAQMVRAEDNGEGIDYCAQSIGADLNAIFDRGLRFKGFPSLLEGVRCKKCGEATKWPRFLLGESPDSKAGILCCGSCQSEVHPKVAQNLWLLQLRRLVKEHGEGWVQPLDTSSCIEKTRRLNGPNLVSEKTVLRELEFAQHLCETALPLLEEDVVSKDTVERMKKDAEMWLGFNSRNWVDCGQIFGSIFAV